jgi:hypothetical protein
MLEYQESYLAAADGGVSVTAPKPTQPPRQHPRLWIQPLAESSLCGGDQIDPADRLPLLTGSIRLKAAHSVEAEALYGHATRCRWRCACTALLKRWDQLRTRLRRQGIDRHLALLPD